MKMKEMSKVWGMFPVLLIQNSRSAQLGWLFLNEEVGKNTHNTTNRTSQQKKK